MLTCVQECAIASQTGDLIKTSAEDFMFEIRVPMTIGTVDWEVVKSNTTPCLQANLVRLVSSQALNIRENFSRIQLLRQLDQYIMSCFIQRGFRNYELYILNKIRISITEILLADIVTSDGTKILQNAFLLLSSNGLRDHYWWPKAPPSFTTSQLAYWQSCLCQTFVISHSSYQERKLKPKFKLGKWTEATVIGKQVTFFSQEEDRIYKRAGLSWLVYSFGGGRSLRARKYIKLTEPALILPPSATKLATTCPRGIYVGVETTTPWQLSDTNKDPTREDPIAGPFLSLEDAFKTSVLCS